MKIMEGLNPVVCGEECSIHAIFSSMKSSEVISILHNIWQNFASDLETPLHRKKELASDLLLKKLNLEDVLLNLIEEWASRKSEKATLSEFIKILKKNQLRKWADHLKNPWNRLNETQKQTVKDQVRYIVPNFSFNENNPPSLPETVYRHLLLQQKPPFFLKWIPDMLPNYVDRTFCTRDMLDQKLFDDEFDENMSDIFAIIGCQFSDLCARVLHTYVTRSSKVLEDINTEIINFMVLDRLDHFDKIYEREHLNRSMHLICKEDDGNFRWKKTNGKLDKLQRFIASSQYTLSQEEFITMVTEPETNRHIIISDGPGMGKSVLLKMIANRLRSIIPERIVLFLFATDFINLVEKIGKIITTETVINGLVQLASENVLEEHKLNSNLRSDKKFSVELLLDGLDELNSREHKIANQIFQVIDSSLKSVRLWVTARQHLLTKLEKTLRTFAFTIKPFNEKEQIHFLTSSWSNRQTFSKTEKSKLNAFSLQFIQMYKSSMITKNQDIAGIPLQCFLIAEAYVKNAIDYARSTDVKVPNIPLNVIDFHLALIKNRYQLYLDNHEVDRMGIINKMQCKIGFELVFKEQAPNLEGMFGNIVQKKNIEMETLNFGIVEYTNTEGVLRFVHPTFAEYFVAWFLHDSLRKEEVSWKKWPEQRFFKAFRNMAVPARIFKLAMEYTEINICIGKDPTEITSFKFCHSDVLYFFNYLIGEYMNSFPKEKLNRKIFKKEQLQEIRKAFGSKDVLKAIMHSCASANFLYILKLLEKINSLKEYKKDIFNEQFLFLIVQTSGADFLKHTMSNFKDHPAFNLDVLTSALCLAVKRGDSFIFEYLLKTEEIKPIQLDSYDGTKLLLHDCVKNTNKNSEEEINQRIQIIRRLLSNYPLLLEQKDCEGKTPLLSKNVHLNLCKELITEFHANLMVRDNKNQTVLLIRNDLSNLEYQKFIRLISKENIDFSKIGCQEALAMAIKTGKDVETMKKLVVLGNSVQPNQENSSTLLHQAAKCGNVEAIGFLIEEQGIELNKKDMDGFTPLDYAISNNQYETGMVLNQLKGTYKNVVNSEGQTWLHIAALEKHVKSVRLLISIPGIDVNSKDHDGNTALHFGVNSFIVTRLLIENGANPEILNESGETAFHSGLIKNQLNTRTFRLLKSKTNLEENPELIWFAKQFVVLNKFEFRTDEYDSLISDLSSSTIEKMPSKTEDFNNTRNNKILNNEGNDVTKFHAKASKLTALKTKLLWAISATFFAILMYYNTIS